MAWAIIQATPEDLEEILNRVLIGEYIVLKIQAKGKKPRCFKCDQKEHIRAEYGPAKNVQSLA